MKRPQISAGTPAVWWSDADEAEWDSICWTLFNGLYRHEPLCRACQERRHCEGAQMALDEAVDWLRGRRLLSRATYLRKEMGP